MISRKKKTVSIELQKEISSELDVIKPIVERPISEFKVVKPPPKTEKVAVEVEESPPWEVLPDELDISKPIKKTESVKAVNPEKKVVVVNINEKTQRQPAPYKKTNKWHEIIPQLDLSGRSAELIKHCLLERKESGMISLVLDKSSEGLLADVIRNEMQTALADYYGEPLTLCINLAKVESLGDSLEENKETLSRRTEREKNETQQQAEKNIESDPFVIELKNRFGAQVVPGSVKPK